MQKLVAVTLFMVLSGLAHAYQPYMVDRSVDAAVTLEFLKAKCRGDLEFGFPTGVYSVSLRHRLSTRVALAADLPFSMIVSEDQRYSSNLLGGLGLALELEAHGGWTEVSLRLPTSGSSYPANVYGDAVDPLKWGAFEADLMIFGVDFHAQRTRPRYRLFFHIGGAGAVASAVGHEDRMYLDLGAGTWIKVGKLDLLGALENRLLGSTASPGLFDYSTHWLVTGIRFTGRTCLPAFHLRVPIVDGFSDRVDFVVGLSFQFPGIEARDFREGFAHQKF